MGISLNDRRDIRYGTALTVALLLACGLPPLDGTAAVKPNVKGIFTGGAFGSSVETASGPVEGTMGRTANLGIPCLGTNGAVIANHVEGLDVNSLLSVGIMDTSAYTTSSPLLARAFTTSRVAGLSLGNLPNPLVSATLLETTIRTEVTPFTIQSEEVAHNFVDLQVAGVPVSLDVPANTVIPLPGLGHVVLRETIVTGDGVNSSEITVNMVHVFVTQANAFGLPIGADIIIGQARNGFVRGPASPVLLDGSAAAGIATLSVEGVTDTTGHLASITLDCGPTAGQTLRNEVAGVNVPGVMSLGTGETTAFADRTGSFREVRTSALIQDVNLLNGLIAGVAIEAVAHSTQTGGNPPVLASDTEGSRFVDFVIAGEVVESNPAPNTVIELPGVGHVVLREQQITTNSGGTSAHVNMIHVYVTDPLNPFGLDVGSDIIVATATSQITLLTVP